jgi:isoquinoline 1-oxidoreductase subunit beta
MLDKDDVTTIMVHHSEMGQGIITALPMILAEEMDADWSKVRDVHVPVADVFKNPDFKAQSTGGSTSVRTSWDTLRQAGATIRTLFINAAAQEWDASPDQCHADNGRVLLKPGQKAAKYSELIAIESG